MMPALSWEGSPARLSPQLYISHHHWSGQQRLTQSRFISEKKFKWYERPTKIHWQSCSSQNKISWKRKKYKNICLSVYGRSFSVNTKYICLSDFGSSFSVNSKAICLSTLFPSIHGSPIVSTEGGAGYLMLSIITTHTSHVDHHHLRHLHHLCRQYQTHSHIDPNHHLIKGAGFFHWTSHR